MEFKTETGHYPPLPQENHRQLSGIAEFQEVVTTALQQVRRATWEACARAYGHENEVEMWGKFRDWQDGE